MTEWILDATVREGRGKGVARKLRRSGQIPAVIYGLHDPQAIQVPEREASRLVQQARGSARMITLRLTEGGKAKPSQRPVLLKEVQTTAVGGHLLHLDFNEIDVKQAVRVSVEVRPVGVASGIKFGGTMQMVLHDVMVECLPTDMPEYIEADVTPLEIGHALHVTDLKFPPGVKPITEGSAAVIVISGQMKEEVAAPVEGVEVPVEGVEPAPAAAEAPGPAPEET